MATDLVFDLSDWRLAMNVFYASQLSPIDRVKMLVRGYLFLADLKCEYPSFSKWFFAKVFPGVYSGNRDVVFITEKDCLAAIAILKNGLSEKKICTLRVASQFQNRGFGSILFEAAFRYLGTLQPLITVPSARYNEFQPILAKYGFKLVEARSGYYMTGSVEYCYNGVLDAQPISDSIFSNTPKTTTSLCTI